MSKPTALFKLACNSFYGSGTSQYPNGETTSIAQLNIPQHADVLYRDLDMAIYKLNNVLYKVKQTDDNVITTEVVNGNGLQPRNIYKTHS